MRCQVDGVNLHYELRGAGVPVVVLHGAGVDHHEIASALEAMVPRQGYQRIYPDLPGMGRSTAEGLQGNDEVVDLLAAFIQRVAQEPVLLLGHSYGAYLARGIAARLPQLVRGLALICPIGERVTRAPEMAALIEDPAALQELGSERYAGFANYFVIRTGRTARRYREHILPGTLLMDERAMERFASKWAVTLDAAPYTGPTLIVAARRDAIVGFVDALDLPQSYPHATLAVIENAGHAVLHEQPELVGALLEDWLRRCDPAPSASRA